MKIKEATKKGYAEVTRGGVLRHIAFKIKDKERKSD